MMHLLDQTGSAARLAGLQIAIRVPTRLAILPEIRRHWRHSFFTCFSADFLKVGLVLFPARPGK
jgi:hypothetical protein